MLGSKTKLNSYLYRRREVSADDMDETTADNVQTSDQSNTIDLTEQTSVSDKKQRKQQELQKTVGAIDYHEKPMDIDQQPFNRLAYLKEHNDELSYIMNIAKSKTFQNANFTERINILGEEDYLKYAYKLRKLPPIIWKPDLLRCLEW